MTHYNILKHGKCANVRAETPLWKRAKQKCEVAQLVAKSTNLVENEWAVKLKKDIGQQRSKVCVPSAWTAVERRQVSADFSSYHLSPDITEVFSFQECWKNTSTSTSAELLTYFLYGLLYIGAKAHSNLILCAPKEVHSICTFWNLTMEKISLEKTCRLCRPPISHNIHQP